MAVSGRAMTRRITALAALVALGLFLFAARPAQASPKTMSCTITYYCPCRKCCGKWSGGPTASGVMPTAGRTVAHGSLPFGTRLLIDGDIYVVEDRGVKGNKVDIYCDSHAEALKLGLRRRVKVEILTDAADSYNMAVP